MSFASVALRELRAEARRPLTHWLRVGGVVGLVLVAELAAFPWTRDPLGLTAWASGLSARDGSLESTGAALFGYLQATVFLGFWLIAPLLTADCLSRERRQGTLQLLFLTRLSPLGIVLGKSLAHALRALSLGLALLPILALTLALGGVSLADLQMAALLDGCALVLGLTAGLLASCWVRDRLKAIGLAELLGAVFALVVMTGHASALRQAVWSSGSGARPVAYDLVWCLDQNLSRSERLYLLLRLSTNLPEPDWYLGRSGAWATASPQWSEVWASYPAAVHHRWLRGVWRMFGLATACAGLGVGIAAIRVRRLWREPGPSQASVALHRTWFTPRFSLRLWCRYSVRALERNPIAWLAMRSAPARLAKWLWCLSMMSVLQIAAMNPDDLAPGLTALAALLLAALTLAAVLALQRELENGILELLLVSPLTPRQILWGRLRALWGQFLPAAAVLGLCYGVVTDLRSVELLELLAPGVVFAWLFAALPVFGLLFSLFRWHPAVSWGVAGACGASGLVLGHWLRLVGYPIAVAWPVAAGCHLGLVGLAWVWAERRLDRRQFALK